MADLYSFDRDSLFVLKPYRMAYPNEDWVLSSLIFKTDNKKVFQTSGGFLQLEEVKELKENLELVIKQKIQSWIMSPLEPNFEFHIQCIEDQKYKISVSYIESFESPNSGKKNINLITNNLNLKLFLSELLNDIENISEHGALP